MDIGYRNELTGEEDAQLATLASQSRQSSERTVGAGRHQRGAGIAPATARILPLAEGEPDIAPGRRVSPQRQPWPCSAYPQPVTSQGMERPEKAESLGSKYIGNADLLS